MTLLHAIRLNVQLPGFAAAMSNLGIGVAYVGFLAFVFGFPIVSAALSGPGLVVWRLSEWRLQTISRRSKR